MKRIAAFILDAAPFLAGALGFYLLEVFYLGMTDFRVVSLCLRLGITCAMWAALGFCLNRARPALEKAGKAITSPHRAAWRRMLFTGGLWALGGLCGGVWMILFLLFPFLGPWDLRMPAGAFQSLVKTLTLIFPLSPLLFGIAGMAAFAIAERKRAKAQAGGA
ncbi:MAG: hypothetical protein MdMp014T_0981 [Treponematales bacterium]